MASPPLATRTGMLPSLPQQGRGSSDVQFGGPFGNAGFDSNALPYGSVPNGSGGNAVHHGSVGYGAPYETVGTTAPLVVPYIPAAATLISTEVGTT